MRIPAFGPGAGAFCTGMGCTGVAPPVPPPGAATVFFRPDGLAAGLFAAVRVRAGVAGVRFRAFAATRAGLFPVVFFFVVFFRAGICDYTPWSKPKLIWAGPFEMPCAAYAVRCRRTRSGFAYFPIL